MVAELPGRFGAMSLLLVLLVLCNGRGAGGSLDVMDDVHRVHHFDLKTHGYYMMAEKETEQAGESKQEEDVRNDLSMQCDSKLCNGATRCNAGEIGLTYRGSYACSIGNGKCCQ